MSKKFGFIVGVVCVALGLIHLSTSATAQDAQSGKLTNAFEAKRLQDASRRLTRTEINDVQKALTLIGQVYGTKSPQYTVINDAGRSGSIRILGKSHSRYTEGVTTVPSSIIASAIGHRPHIYLAINQIPEHMPKLNSNGEKRSKESMERIDELYNDQLLALATALIDSYAFITNLDPLLAQRDFLLKLKKHRLYGRSTSEIERKKSLDRINEGLQFNKYELSSRGE